MSESFNVSGNLLFVKDSLIQFVSSGKQNVLSFRILIGISSADTLSEDKCFTTFLTVASETCWNVKLKSFLDFPWVWFLEPYHHRH